MKKKKIYTIFIPIALLFICTIIVVYEMTRHGSDSNKNNDNAQPINLKDVREENSNKNNNNEEEIEDENIQKTTNNNATINEKTDNKKNNVTTERSTEQKKESNNNKTTDNTINSNYGNNENVASNNNSNDDSNNSNNVQEKIDETSKKEVVDSIKEYYCEEPFKLNGSKCEYTLSVNALIKYTCELGTLNGTKCDTSTTIEHEYFSRSAKEYCNSLYGSGAYQRCLCQKDGGAYNANSQKCFKSIKTQTNANIEYYCTNGTTLNGDKCQKHYEINALYKLSCPNGYNLKNFQCEK